MNVFTDIEVAMQMTLNSLGDKPYIQWEGSATTIPTIGTRWWRPTNIPSTNTMMTIDGVQLAQGIYQVDIFTKENNGLVEMLTDMDNIYDVFTTNTTINQGNNKIDIYAISRGRVVRDGAWLHGYVQINYKCYTH